jgi:hypothetical protein
VLQRLGRMYAVRGPHSKAVGQCSKTGGFALVAPDDVVCHRRGCRTGNFGETVYDSKRDLVDAS